MRTHIDEEPKRNTGEQLGWVVNEATRQGNRDAGSDYHFTAVQGSLTVAVAKPVRSLTSFGM